MSDKLRAESANGCRMLHMLHIRTDQAFLLHAVRDMALLADDHDTVVIETGKAVQGMPTGYKSPIPSSGTCPTRTKDDGHEGLPLEECLSHWLSAEEDPDTTQVLIQK